MSTYRVLLVDPPAALAGRESLDSTTTGTRLVLTVEPTVDAALDSHDSDPADGVVIGETGSGDSDGNDNSVDSVDTTTRAAVETIRAADESLSIIVFGAEPGNGLDALLTAGATDYVHADTADAIDLLAHRIERAIECSSPVGGRQPHSQSTAALATLYETTNQADLSFAEKLDSMLEIGTRELGYPIAYLTRIENEMVEIRSVVGDHELLERGLATPLADSYCQFTIERDDGEAIAIADATTESLESLPAYAEFDLQCYVGAELTVDGETYGTLCFADREPRAADVINAQRPTVTALAQWASYEVERHEYERELERQIDRLEEFTGIVSHDLRNPLNVAQGRTELATADCDSEHLSVVDTALDRMEAIIEDSLTLARQGQAVETKEPIEMRTLLERCWEIVDTADSELRVVDDFTVHGDPNRLAQIFENLFRNAIEHSTAPVTIRVGLQAVMYTTTRAETDGTFTFYVEDDGPGIPEDRRESAFDPGETTRPDGTGFGLAIVRRIAEAHGWEVHLTESIDGGARFEFQNVT